MIEDSDIGPENHQLSAFSIDSKITEIIIGVLKNPINWVMLLYVIFFASLDGVFFPLLSVQAMLILLFGSLGIHVVTEALLFHFSKKGLQWWDFGRSEKLSRENKSRKYGFVKCSNQTIKIGDLILVKSNCVCPADVLIVDTGYQKNGQKIANVNESKLTGSRDIKIKKSIKNLGSNSLIGDQVSIKVTKHLEKILESLKGSIEYEDPIYGLKVIDGSFKLQNDPKVMRIREENVLFCGSKIYTSWIIGIVLYNGKNTKIFRHNFKHDADLSKVVQKSSTLTRLSILVTWIFLGTIFAEALVIFCHLTLQSENQKNLIELFNGQGSWFKLKTLVQSFMQLLSTVPLLLQSIIEIMNFIHTIRTERLYLESSNSLDTVNDLQNSSKKLSPEQLNQPLTQRTEREVLLENEEQSQAQSPELPTQSAVQSKKDGKLKNMLSDGQSLEKVDGSSKNRFQEVRSKEISELAKKSQNGPGFLPQNDRLSIIRHSSLYELGNIQHAIFDKSDTLAASSIKLVKLITCTKLYNLDVSNLEAMFEEVQKDPSKYQKQENLEELMKLKEDDDYSEKSQEFFKEVKGEYQSDIFDEDAINDKGMMSGKNSYREEASVGLEKFISGTEAPTKKSFSSNTGKPSTVADSPINLKSSKVQRRSGFRAIEVSPNTETDNHNEQEIIPNEKMRVQGDMIKIMIDLKLKEKMFAKKILDETKKTRKHSPTKKISKRNQHSSNSSQSKNSIVSNDDPDKLGSSNSSSSIKSSVTSQGESFSDLDLMHKENRIQVNIDNQYDQSDLLVDYVFKSKEINEVLECMILCHESDSRSSKRFSSFVEEEKALIGMCSKLGLSYEVCKKHPSSSFVKSIKKKVNGYIEDQINIVGINGFSPSRMRMSIVVNHQSRGRNSYVLYARGKDHKITDVLDLGLQEKAQLKKLLVKIKNQGLKTIILAKKDITADLAISYMKTNQIIMESNKDQAQNQERLAIEIEQSSQFLGILAYKDNIMPGAENFLKSLNQSGVKVSMLTGDKFFNTFTVSRTLKIIDYDLRDLDKYYSLKFKNRTEALVEFNRILDGIYQILRERNVENLEEIEKLRALEAKIDEFQSGGKNRKQMRRRDKRLQTSISNDTAFRKSNHKSIPEDSLQKRTTFKSILIDGQSLEVVLKSSELVGHLRFLLYFSKNLIGYSLHPSQKGRLVQIIKEANRHENILAIGDGFNDIAMIKKADVGIQLFSKEVPFIFGDILVSNLNVLNEVMFGISTSGFQSKVTIILSIFYSYLSVNLQYTLCSVLSLQYGNYLPSGWIFSHILVIDSSLVLYGIFCDSGKSPFLLRFPILYKESQEMKQSFARLLGQVYLYVVFETIYIWAGLQTTISGITVEGRNISQVFISESFLIIFSGLHICRIIILGNQISLRQKLWICLAICLLFVITLPLRSVDDATRALEFYKCLFSNWRLLSVFLVTMAVPSICQFSLISYKTHSISHPLLKDLIRIFTFNKEEFSEISATDSLSTKMKIRQQQTMIERIKLSYQINVKFLHEQVKSILSLEFNHYSLGITRLTSHIIDRSSSRRFQIFLQKAQHGLIINHLTACLLLWFLEFVLLNLNDPISSSYYYFETPVPYFFIILTIPLSFATFKGYQKSLLRSFKVSIFFCLAIWMILTQLNRFPLEYGSIVLLRLVSGPIIVGYRTSAILILLMYTVYFFGGFSFRLARGSGEEINLNLWTGKFMLKLGKTYFVVLVYFMLLKLKFDTIIKMEYLAKTRVKSEYITSNEKLKMLMPKFVLDRIGDFRMSQDFVADDAGDVTILFCDIVDFDDVIRDCQNQIVEILDELFRAFDLLCKRHGVQKIETVGKTYMACTGLKFVESDYPPQIRKVCAARRCLDMSKGMMKFVEEFTFNNGRKLVIKIGIHTGQCYFGILGYHKPQFSLVGDTVNTTSRHCTTGERGNITLSKESYESLTSDPEYTDHDKNQFEERFTEMKGKGKVKTYILNFKRDFQRLRRKNRITVPQNQILAAQNSGRELNFNDRQSSGFQKRYGFQRQDSLAGPQHYENDSHFSISQAELHKSSDDVLESLENQDASQMIDLSVDASRLEDSFDIKDTARSRNKAHQQETGKPERQRASTKPNQNGAKISQQKTTSSYDFDDASSDEEETNKSLDLEEVISKEHNIIEQGENLGADPIFGNTSNQVEEFYLRKILKKGYQRILVAVCLLAVDQLAGLISDLTDEERSNGYILDHFLRLAIIVTLAILVIFQALKRKPRLMKLTLLIVIYLKIALEILNFMIHHIKKEYHQREQHLIEMILNQVLYGSFLNVIGIFYFKEHFCYQRNLHLIHTLVVTAIFNLSDARIHGIHELRSFNNLIKIERKSLYLSQFVERLLPKHIQQQVTQPGVKPGRIYRNVTILFADIVGFTQFSNDNGTRKVVEMLSQLFTAFDKECSRLNLYKVYTIGDCYVVMGFLDNDNRKSPEEEANDVTLLAISMIETINRLRAKLNITTLNMRIGIHTGDVIGGVIGTDLVRFDIYGEDVVVANKMESGGQEGKINVSEQTRKLLELNENSNYTFTENKPIYVKSSNTKYKSFFLNFDQFLSKINC